MAGWTSVLVRTERGRLAFEAARAKLDVRGLDDPAALLRLDALDKQIANRTPAAQARPGRPAVHRLRGARARLRRHRPPARLHPPLTVAGAPVLHLPDEPTVRAEGWLAAVLDGAGPRRGADRGRRRRAPGCGPAGGAWPAAGLAEDGPRARSSWATGARSGCGWPASAPGRSAAPASSGASPGASPTATAPGCEPPDQRPAPVSRSEASPSAARACRCWRGSTGGVDPGERWVILGPNGSGKTTLLQVAAARLWPTAGTVEVLGARLGRGRRADAASTGRAGQRCGDPAAAGGPAGARRRGERPPRRARDLVAPVLGRRLGEGGRPAGPRRGRARSRDRPFGVISEGERQHVLLARALMSDPELLLLDEPFAGLDLGARERLLVAARRARRRPGEPAGRPGDPPLRGDPAGLHPRGPRVARRRWWRRARWTTSSPRRRCPRASACR